MGRWFQGTGSERGQIQPVETGRGSTPYQELEVCHAGCVSLHSVIKKHSTAVLLTVISYFVFHQAPDSCALSAEKEF